MTAPTPLSEGFVRKVNGLLNSGLLSTDEQHHRACFNRSNAVLQSGVQTFLLVGFSLSGQSRGIIENELAVVSCNVKERPDLSLRC